MPRSLGQGLRVWKVYQIWQRWKLDKEFSLLRCQSLLSPAGPVKRNQPGHTRFLQRWLMFKKCQTWVLQCFHYCSRTGPQFVSGLFSCLMLNWLCTSQSELLRVCQQAIRAHKAHASPCPGRFLRHRWFSSMSFWFNILVANSDTSVLCWLWKMEANRQVPRSFWRWR